MTCFGDVALVRGISPLVYPRWETPADRIALVDPEVPPAPPWATYFAPTARTIRQGKTGRYLKHPRFEPIPGADPGVVAFLDYHIIGHDPLAVYLDYMTTRADQMHQGYARKLIDAWVALFPPGTYLDFGKIMSDAVWRLYTEKRDAGLNVHGHRY